MKQSRFTEEQIIGVLKQAGMEHSEHRISLEQVDAELERIAQDSKKPPDLSPEPLTRESFY